MKLTVHAVEQYQSRHRPELSTPEAFAELRARTEGARKFGPAPRGGDLYVCPGGLRIVAKWDRRELVVITVFPASGDLDADVESPVVEPDPYDPRSDLSEVHQYLRRRSLDGDRRAGEILRRCSRLWG